MFCRFGFPKRVITDNASHFTARALGDVLNALSLEGKGVIILGDMKINLLDSTNGNVSEYITCFSGHAYERLISTPTRVAFMVMIF